jgi:hypothetical protein
MVRKTYSFAFPTAASSRSSAGTVLDAVEGGFGFAQLFLGKERGGRLETGVGLQRLEFLSGFISDSLFA